MPGRDAEAVFLDLKAGGEEAVLKKFPPPFYFTAFIDGGAALDKAGLLREAAAALRFPSYFGGNWDALLDCLRTLPEFLPAGGYVLAVRDSGRLLSGSPADLETFSDIVLEAAAFLREKTGKKLVVALI